MRSVVRHRFTFILGAAALLLGCTVSDVEKKPATATDSTGTQSQVSAQPGVGATSSTAMGSVAPASDSITTAGTRSNMSPDSVDVGHTSPNAVGGANAQSGSTTSGTSADGTMPMSGSPASSTGASAATSGKASKSDTLPMSSLRLEVDLTKRKLTVFDHDRPVASHSVAVGSSQWPTMTGSWEVKQVIWNPEWIPPDETWAEQSKRKAPGAPDNPLGRAQLVYDPPRTIHGTNEPASIGKAVSHGSIRLPNAVVTQLGRQLMQATGVGKDDAWYRRVQQNRTEKVVVDLPQRVPIVVK